MVIYGDQINEDLMYLRIYVKIQGYKEYKYGVDDKLNVHLYAEDKHGFVHNISKLNGTVNDNVTISVCEIVKKNEDEED